MDRAKREELTLSFSNKGLDRGCIEESMEPWDETVIAFRGQGYDTGLLKELHGAELPTEDIYAWNAPFDPWHYYYNTMQTDAILKYETGLGWDPVARITFRVPYICFDEEVLEDRAECQIRRDRDGWIRKYPKDGSLLKIVQPVVTDEESWEALKTRVRACIEKDLTPEHLEEAYGPYRGGGKDYAVRLRVSGFFWTPRFLLGDEEHLMGYYDYPEMLKDIAQFTVDIYKEQFEKIFKIVTPSLIFFEEDLSGKNGPMISKDIFREFITPYYQQIIPFLKERGVKNVFMDTDGDFTMLIPEIMGAGLDGFLPIDVNSGVDIVKVREQYPTLKFFGGFNKLVLLEGKEAIEAELERLRPVIRQGGCIICTDHQAPPQTPIENYLYYTRRLKETMAELRGEH